MRIRDQDVYHSFATNELYCIVNRVVSFSSSLDLSNIRLFKEKCRGHRSSVRDYWTVVRIYWWGRGVGERQSPYIHLVNQLSHQLEILFRAIAGRIDEYTFVRLEAMPHVCSGDNFSNRAKRAATERSQKSTCEKGLVGGGELPNMDEPTERIEKMSERSLDHP